MCEDGFVLGDYRYFGHEQNSGIDIRLLSANIVGSKSVVIDWGDATVERMTVSAAGPSIFHHVYANYGQYNGTLAASDDGGCQSTSYFSVLVSKGGLPNWWMLGIIPLAGGMVYLVSSFVSAYQNQRIWVSRLPEPKDRPQGWPATRPWLKPAYGADKEPNKIAGPKKKPPG